MVFLQGTGLPQVTRAGYYLPLSSFRAEKHRFITSCYPRSRLQKVYDTWRGITRSYEILPLSAPLYMNALVGTFPPYLMAIPLRSYGTVFPLRRMSSYWDHAQYPECDMAKWWSTALSSSCGGHSPQISRGFRDDMAPQVDLYFQGRRNRLNHRVDDFRDSHLLLQHATYPHIRYLIHWIRVFYNVIVYDIET